MVILWVLLVAMVGSCAGSSTVLSTRAVLENLAREAAPQDMGVGRTSALKLRTGFFRALSDIERSIVYAEANFTPYSEDRSTRLLLKMRKSIVSAGKKGRFKIGRELFGFTRFLEDSVSYSRSRKRSARSTSELIDYLQMKLGERVFNELFNIISGTSVTFVIDTTGSMAPDIEQVKAIVRALSSPQEEEDGSGFYSYMMCPFKDPGYGPVEDYSDKGELLSALELLSVYGGGDCDEMVMHGINEALMISEAYSPIFVFTDAGSKDRGELETVISLAQSYMTPIYFFLTPNPECVRDDSVYESVASESAGQVLSLSKEELNEMTEYVKSTGVGKSDIVTGSEATSNDNTSVKVVDKRSTDQTHAKRSMSRGQRHDITFDCDETVRKLLVTVNFHNVTGACYLLSPSRQLILPVFVSDVSNMRLYQVDEPDPGAWTLKAITDTGDKFTYKVSSVSPSNVDFDFYFMVERRGRIVPATHVKPGEVMNLKLNMLGGRHVIKQENTIVLLIDTQGNTISTVQTLTLSSELEFQYDGAFIVPDESFKVMVFGETVGGYPFTRTSQATVQPSKGILQPIHGLIKNRMIRPGSSGNFYFKFEHFSNEDMDFKLSFTNPDSIIRDISPFYISNIRSSRSKLIRLPYSISRYTPEGTEYRISLVMEGGDIKSSYVHTILVTRFAERNRSSDNRRA